MGAPVSGETAGRERLLIAGDVGATTTRLGLYSRSQGPRDPLITLQVESARFEGLAPIVARLLEGQELSEATPFVTATIGIAGPVADGRVDVTHLPWTVDAEELRASLELRRVTLLNDLEAVAHALPHLEGGEVHTLRPGQPRECGALAVIAPGTGLGEAFSVWSGQRYLPCASEGGHAAFAPANALEAELMESLRQGDEPVECDSLCSGRGIPRIYDFLRARRESSTSAAEPQELAERIASASDRAPIIVEAALEDTSGQGLCAATVRFFADILAGEARNLALKVLPRGGLYLGGGIPPRILPFLEQGKFARRFDNGGQFNSLLAAIPLHVILTEAGMLGAAVHGLELAEVGTNDPTELR